MATSPEKWETVKALFGAAMELDSRERSAFLRENCSDAKVRAEVDRLLAEHDNVGAFLSTPVLAEFPIEAEASSPRLSEDDLLADRFRIVRFIARGGMGEVYEAEDLELRERVAVKTILPEILAQPNAIARFRREVHLARQVTHPNVCRIFDLFRDKPDSTYGEDIVFISMELLHGDDLGKRLKNGERMSTEEAFPLIQQMGSAMAAAHTAGIIHRDFKPQNVLLVSAPGKESKRAVVTDFGLALRSETSGEASSFSTGQGLLGTPAYMSPEQIEGRAATVASDIYALGLVIYEMITGNRPFQGDTPMSVAIKRLSSAPTPPRKFKADLSPIWESVILRCLERDPARRFAKAEDVARALAGEKSLESRINAVPTRFGRERTVFLVITLLIVAGCIGGLGIASYASRHRHSKNDPEKPGSFVQGSLITARPSVAVLGFKNLSGRLDEAWLSTTLAETIDAELAAGEQLRTIPQENVTRMKNDFALPDAESYAPDTLHRIRSNLGTDYVIEGAYVALGRESGGQIHLNARLQDTRTGETVASVVESGRESGLNDLFAKAGADLRARLGVRSISDLDEAAGRASLPANLEAARNYAEGIDKARKLDFVGSRESFEKALAMEPDFALGHFALSVSWSQLFHDVKAKEEVRIAFDLSKNLPREDRLNIEARLREANGERDRAVEIYKTLFTFFPDNVDYGLHLANAQALAGKAKDALVTVRSLRTLPSPQRDDPRIDLAEENADYFLGDFKNAYLLAVQAAEKALQVGSPALFAKSRHEQGSTLRLLGDAKGAILAFEDARRFYLKTGNRGALARVLLSSSIVHRDQGELDQAKTQLNEGLRVAEEIGDNFGSAAAASNLAGILTTQGDFQEAKIDYERALKNFNELGRKDGATASLAGLGVVLTSEGNLSGAVTKFQESLILAREIGDRQSIQYDLYALATQWVNMGRLEQADAAYLEALDVARRMGSKLGVVGDLSGRAEMLIAKGDLRAARQSLEEAMKLAQDSNEKPATASVRIDMGALSIEEGHADTAVTPLKEAIEELRSEKDVDGEASALVVLARSFLAQNKIPDARESITNAEKIVKKSHNLLIGVDMAIVAARIEAASGRTLEAKSGLKQVIADAARMQCIECDLDARLALGEVEMKSQDVASGKARLLTLQKDAAAKGFILIARKAAVLGPN